MSSQVRQFSKRACCSCSLLNLGYFQETREETGQPKMLALGCALPMNRSQIVFRFGLPTQICLFVALAFAPAGMAHALVADDTAATGSSTGSANHLGPDGIVPVQTGYNFSLVSSSLHDSGSGWSSILTPDLAYRFNRRVSVDVASPAYVYFLTSVNTGTTASPSYTDEARYFALGDSTVAGHLDFNGNVLSYSFTAAMGIPTGNTTYGLTANQFTYNLNNHFDLSVGKVSPDMEVGISDSSTLINQRLTRGRSFTTTGKLAHFQAGAAIDLPFNASFEADGYEDLPIGAQQVFGSTKGHKGHSGRGGKTGGSTTAVSSSLAEDNGIDTSLDIPLKSHLVLSGIYGYSLRQQDQTAGFSITFLLRAAPKGSE